MFKLNHSYSLEEKSPLIKSRKSILKSEGFPTTAGIVVARTGVMPLFSFTNLPDCMGMNNFGFHYKYFITKETHKNTYAFLAVVVVENLASLEAVVASRRVVVHEFLRSCLV